MIPQPNQNVFIVFRSGLQIEGTVISWSDAQSTLKSLTGTSTIVIQKTLDDILFFRINDATKEFNELKDKTNKQQEDLQTLAKLRNDLNELERAELRERLTSHQPSNPRTINYDYPSSIIKKPSPQQYPRTQTARENSGINTSLQNLFSKK